jgi:hypothetical protein
MKPNFLCVILFSTAVSCPLASAQTRRKTVFKRNSSQILSPSLLLVVGLSGFVHGFCHGQQLDTPPQRQVNVAALNLYAPIAVTEVLSLGNAYVLPRGPNQSVSFQDGSPEWIGDVAVVVKNQSPKDIVAIEARVAVAAWEQDPKRPHRFIRFHEGQLPAHALQLGDGTPIPEESSMALDVKPGASTNLPLKRAFSKLGEKAAGGPPPGSPSPDTPLASAPSIWIQMERIFFADGTMWAFNAYLKPDPTSPGAYIQVTPEEWKSH